jgi:hypothetical protein
MPPSLPRRPDHLTTDGRFQPLACLDRKRRIEIGGRHFDRGKREFPTHLSPTEHKKLLLLHPGLPCATASLDGSVIHMRRKMSETVFAASDTSLAPEYGLILASERASIPNMARSISSKRRSMLRANSSGSSILYGFVEAAVFLLCIAKPLETLKAPIVLQSIVPAVDVEDAFSNSELLRDAPQISCRRHIPRTKWPVAEPRRLHVRRGQPKR